MNRDKREPEYPTELESQFIMRLPEEPAKVLREVLKTGESLKNRLTIQVENDMRQGEVHFDDWAMHAKIVDLPTIVESLKTIDNKSFYKTADIAQMMICKYEPDQPTVEEEQPPKNKKKDPYKIDKKFLWPHGITPPTKNVRKRRFRKTLKKKYVEAPEIEKEVKRLLRADNEAVSITWEVIEEDDDLAKLDKKNVKKNKNEKKTKQNHSKKQESTIKSAQQQPSNVVDIFGGAVSDSDAEEEKSPNIKERRQHKSKEAHKSGNSVQKLGEGSSKKGSVPIELGSDTFKLPHRVHRSKGDRASRRSATSTSKNSGLPSDNTECHSRDMSKENMTSRIEQLKAEVDELKLRRQRTKHEITNMVNHTLKQRFQDILHTLNQDIMYKEMEYQGLLTLQNSEVI